MSDACESGAATLHAGPVRYVREGATEYALCLAHVKCFTRKGGETDMADTSVEVVVSDTMRHVLDCRKVLDGIAQDREQTETTRALARKARRALNDLIANTVSIA